jgi:hypothetical protein
MSITEIVDEMRANGESDEDINYYITHDYPREIAEAQAEFIEEYENRPEVQDGWAQQDLIDSYHREQ